MQRLVAPPGAACAAPLRLRPCRARRSSRLAASASATPTAVKATLRRPLGIVFAERGKPGEAAGVRIDELTPGGNAASAGLQIGDVLVRVSATLLKDGKEGQYEKEGYGQRPYTNWSRQMIDVRACDFETIMNAISSNNERWGIMDVVLELERGSGAGAGPVAAPEPMAPPPPPPPAAETLVELDILSPQGESIKVRGARVFARRGRVRCARGRQARWPHKRSPYFVASPRRLWCPARRPAACCATQC